MNADKPFLIIQLRPEDETSDSEYQAILRYGGLSANETRRLRIESDGIPRSLKLDQYAAIIVGGSPFDISTPEQQKTPIQLRIESDFRVLLEQVVARDFPFLGACSGNGLLGAFLGAPISGRYAEAVGCVPVDLTADARDDPLLTGFPPRIMVLLGHKEACDHLPEGATLLMRGEACPVQMFRVGRNVYATQFHPEGDAEGFILRIRVYRHHGYFAPAQAEQLIDAVSAQPTPWAQAVLQRFVTRYRNN